MGWFRDLGVLVDTYVFFVCKLDFLCLDSAWFLLVRVAGGFLTPGAEGCAVLRGNLAQLCG